MEDADSEAAGDWDRAMMREITLLSGQKRTICGHRIMTAMGT
jgi:hypothetical protein